VIQRIFVFYWILCFAVTHVPLRGQEPPIPGLDKVIHLALYGILAALFYFSIKSKKAPLRIQLKTTALVLVLYSLVDEITQPLVGRSCDGWDLLADWIGLSIGLWVAVKISHGSSDGQSQRPL